MARASDTTAPWCPKPGASTGRVGCGGSVAASIPAADRSTVAPMTTPMDPYGGRWVGVVPPPDAVATVLSSAVAFHPATPATIAPATVEPSRLDCCNTARCTAAASGLLVAESTNTPLPQLSA